MPSNPPIKKETELFSKQMRRLGIYPTNLKEAIKLLLEDMRKLGYSMPNINMRRYKYKELT